jgi:ribosome biogenesis GTPase A
MVAVSAMQPHMRQAVLEISQRMRSVDLVIEMRDARIPHTSANYNLINLIRGKPKRLLLLNKADLAHKRFRQVLSQSGTDAAHMSASRFVQPEQGQPMRAGDVARARISETNGAVHLHICTGLCSRSARSSAHLSPREGRKCG